MKFEDGSPITSKEIAYGIARSFDPDLTGGPTYLQEWLADSPQYDTKWDFKANKTSLPPGLTTPDAKTLRFEFAKPHCDLPFAASLPTTAPLPPDKDTGVNLDNQPFSSGPYKITKNTGRRASSSWSATRTGTRTPTRCATSTRTSSSGASARPPTRPPTG